jgi:hypothetical protein
LFGLLLPLVLEALRKLTLRVTGAFYPLHHEMSSWRACPPPATANAARDEKTEKSKDQKIYKERGVILRFYAA